MSSVRNRRNRQSNDSFEQRVEDYHRDEDQQQLLPPPPSPFQNGAVKYVIKKFGWWILVIMFPYIFGPIIALRNVYSRSKRGYMAAKYAHDSGYTDYFWTLLPAGATQFVITAIYIVTLGKYDLTDFFERGISRSPQRRYNLRRRGQDTDSEIWDQDLQDQQYSSREPLINEEDDDEEYDRQFQRLPAPTGLFAPIIRAWRFIKMCFDLFFLGLYTAFGWTFGRYVEEDGELVKKKYSKRSRMSRNGSMRSNGTSNNSMRSGSRADAQGELADLETAKKYRKLPWIVLGLVLLVIVFELYSKFHHGGHKNSTHH